MLHAPQNLYRPKKDDLVNQFLHKFTNGLQIFFRKTCFTGVHAEIEPQLLAPKRIILINQRLAPLRLQGKGT